MRERERERKLLATMQAILFKVRVLLRTGKMGFLSIID